MLSQKLSNKLFLYRAVLLWKLYNKDVGIMTRVLGVHYFMLCLFFHSCAPLSYSYLLIELPCPLVRNVFTPSNAKAHTNLICEIFVKIAFEDFSFLGLLGKFLDFSVIF